jgi:hypothetical protein
MNLSESESVPYEYNVYYSPEGDKYFAIGELSIDNIRTDSPLAEFAHTHYSYIEMFYWVLIFFVAFYLVTTHIAAPLFYRYRQNSSTNHTSA